MTPIEISKSIHRRLAAIAGDPVPRMRAWDGSTWGPSDALSTIVLQHPGSLRALLLPPSDLAAGEAYVFDDVDFEGDILTVLDFGRRLQPLSRGTHRFRALPVLRDVRRLPDQRRRPDHRPGFAGRLHSRDRDRAAVTHHYDTGNDFFAQFLDPLMVYSCAHFLDPHGDTLEEAQRRKLDVICRKLDLGIGQRFLDVGCGWGALVIHAAVNYGVEAVGVTLSGEQAELGLARAKQAGVEDRVTILQADYRDIDGTYDAIASIGMFEHVGRDQLSRYFATMRRLLTPGGAFLNHGITTRDRGRGRVTPTFVNTYVFPDGQLVPIEDVVGAAEESGFELRDLESLRMSYGQTLRRWVRNLEENREAATAFTDERVYRIWRLYMAASVLAFEHGGLSVFQLLLSDVRRPWSYGRRRLLASDDV